MQSDPIPIRPGEAEDFLQRCGADLRSRAPGRTCQRGVHRRQRRGDRPAAQALMSPISDPENRQMGPNQERSVS